MSERGTTGAAAWPITRRSFAAAALAAVAGIPAGSAPQRLGPSVREPWRHATESQLRAFRGAISTVRLDLPYGPRPGRDDNVLFTPTYPVYGRADRARMIAAYRSRGYTHWAIGPVSHRRRLYHDQYPPASFDSITQPDRYADLLEELWRAGEVPAYFALPDTSDYAERDGWDWAAVDRDLTPIYRSRRWQALVRVAVLAWEPDVPAREWERAARWLARAFPEALRYIHMPADQRAPCRSSDVPQGTDTRSFEATCWRQVAPYLHGVLYQSGVMGRPASSFGGRAPVQKFRHDLWEEWRLLHEPGISSAKHDRPLDLVAFEYASYWSYWKNVPEATARAWGDAAVGKGDDAPDPVTHERIVLRGKTAGYGDGGTVTPPGGKAAYDR